MSRAIIETSSHKLCEKRYWPEYKRNRRIWVLTKKTEASTQSHG